MSIRWRPGVCVCVYVCACVGLSKCLVCEQLGYLYVDLAHVEPSVEATDVSTPWHESP